MTGDEGCAAAAAAAAATDTARFPIVVVMGVSTVGKSSVGKALAQTLGVPFLDGDDMHPQANIAKMTRGGELTDEDRAPWLARVALNLARVGSDGGVVIACSALRHRYRDRLREGAPTVRFVHLTGSEELLAERAAARSGHFMPPALLASQLRTLEPLDPDERGVRISVNKAVSDVCMDAVTWLCRDMASR